METIVAIEDAIPARYYHDFCLIGLHQQNSGWRCFHPCWAISNKIGMGIPAKSTRQGQMPPPDQRSLPPIFINLFESGEIHQHGNLSRSEELDRFPSQELETPHHDLVILVFLSVQRHKTR